MRSRGFIKRIIRGEAMKTNKRHIVTAFLVIALAIFNLSYSLCAKSLHFIEYSINQFPNVSATLFYLDSSSKSINNLSKADFLIRTNGNEIEPASISIPEQNAFENLSLLLSLDLALNSKQGDKSNFDLAKELLAAMLELFDYENNEFALTSFDWMSYLNSEYTNDKQFLKEQLSLLKTSTGSKLEQAFLDDPAGALNIAAKSKYRSSILLITEGGNVANLPDIISFAKDNHISINVISFEKTISLDLKSLAEESAGFYFDNVANRFEMQDLAAIVHNVLWNYKPFRLNWESPLLCEDLYSNEIIARNEDLKVDFSFIAPSRLKPTLQFNPNYLRFSAVQPGTNKELFVNLKAINGDIIVKGFSSEDSRFEVLKGALAQNEEVLIKEGDSIEISVLFTPSDSAVLFSKLTINSSACLGKELIMTGGFPNTPPIERTLKIEYPNNGETLIAGDTTSIKWSGLLPDDVIQLEWSRNAGENWDTLSVDITGLEYKWHVPNIESERCLIRAIQLWPNNIGETRNLHHPAGVNCANFNQKDGRFVLTASSDKFARVWNSNTGAEILKLIGHSKSVLWAEFNHQETLIASASEDSTAIIWSFPDGELIHSLIGHKDIVSSVTFSPDGQKLVSSSWDGTVIVWDASSGEMLRQIQCSQGKIWHVVFNKDGSEILTAGSYGKAKLWNVNTGSLIQVYDAQKSNEIISFASFSPDDERIVTASWYGVASVWNKASADTIFTITHKDEDGGLIPLYSAGFYVRANELVLLTSGIDHARIWNGNSGELKAVLSEHSSSVPYVTMNFDGSRILTSSWDSTAKVWNLDKRDLQMDTTDNLFSILKQKAKAYSFDLGKVQAGSAFDTTLNVFLENLSSFAYPIKSIELKGKYSDEFQIISLEKASTLDSLEKKSVKIRFAPQDAGERTCYLDIVFSNFSLKAEIKARAFNLPLFIKNNRINFGTVEIADFKDSLITAAIKNISMSPISCSSIILKGPDDNHFDIIHSFESFTLLPNEEQDITVRFNPETLGRKNGIISFVHNADGGESLLYLFGEGINPLIDTVSISIGEFSASPGEIVNIPISYKKKSQKNISNNFKSIKADLSFNVSLLEPLMNAEEDDISNNIRTISLEIPGSNEDYNFNLQFRAALGNDTLSQLKLSNVQPVGHSKVYIDYKSGIFHLKDLCKEGGTRLFDSNNKLLLAQNKPNPFENQTTIEIELLEKGMHSLLIIDETGKIVKNVFAKNLQPGKYYFDLNCSDLPAGMFFYLLSTPSQSLIKQMLIQK